MRKFGLGIAGTILALSASPVWGQITVPNTFTANTTASASQVNANFSALATNALNRSGGTITGNITVDSGLTIDGVDISAVLGGGAIATGVATFTSTTLPQLNVLYDASNKVTVSVSSVGGVTFDATGSGAGFSFSDNLSVDTAAITTLTLTTLTCTDCVGATQVVADAIGSAELAASGVTPGTYGNGTSTLPGVVVLDSDGRATSATQVNVSALTGIVETAITDGSLLARVAGNEAISGTWSFTSASGLSVTNALVAGSLRLTTGAVSRPDNAGSAANFGNGTNDFYATTHNFKNGVGDTTFVSVTSDGIDVNGTVTGDVLSISGAATVSGLLSASALSVDSTSMVLIKSSLGSESATLFATGDYLAGGSPGVAVSIVESSVTSTPLAVNPQSVMTANIYPNADNLRALGDSVLRWTTVYAVTGTINTSDAREKRDIKPIELGIEFIDQLAPKEYFWRDPKISGKFYGFIAQDVDKLGFEGVDKSNPERWGLRYTELIAPMVKGLQEVHAEVHQLERQNRMLQAEIVVLAQRLQRLESGKAVE